MDLSIIIVNWNTCDLLADCLKSIYTTTQDLSFETIVIDNGSSDGSVARVQAEFPQVRLVVNGQNVGFAPANNQGIARGQGRYLLLLNSDTQVQPGALAALVRFADAQPQAGVVGCRLLNADGSLQPSWANFPTVWTEVTGQLVRGGRVVANQAEAVEVDWVGGACFLVRAKAVAAVGLLDERYFMYAEEVDWCYRMQQYGWKIYYLVNAQVIHLGGGSASRASFGQLRRLYESKLRFFAKHYGHRQAEWLRYGLIVANGLGLARRLLIGWLKRGEWSTIHDRLVAQGKLILYLAQSPIHE
jgi:GT2 family glycosyltransferase